MKPNPNRRTNQELATALSELYALPRPKYPSSIIVEVIAALLDAPTSTAEPLTSDGLVFLEITGCIGIGAEHYYGRLRWCRGTARCEQHLTRSIDARDAAYLNRKDGAIKSGRFKPGDKTERFDLVQDVILSGIRCWKEAVPVGRLLVLGSWSAIEPMVPLAGEPVLVARAAALVDGALDCRGARDLDDPSYDRIVEAWSTFTRGPTKKVKKRR